MVNEFINHQPLTIDHRENHNEWTPQLVEGGAAENPEQVRASVISGEQETMSTLTDEQLAALAQQGNMEAFWTLWQRHRSTVYAFCRRCLPSPDDAADAASDALLRAFWELDKFDAAKGSFRNWLLKIAQRICYQRFRERQRLPLADEEVDFDEFPDDAETPTDERLTEREEFFRRAIRAVNALPPPQRAVFHKFIEGYSHAEISVQLGMTRNNVAVYLHRALRHLRKELGIALVDVWTAEHAQGARGRSARGKMSCAKPS